MILDTSALIAILTQEPDAEPYIDAISRAGRGGCRISTGNYLELALVIEGQFGGEVLAQSDALLRHLAVVVEPFTAEQASFAAPGLSRFRQEAPPSRFKLRGLLRLRPRQSDRRTAAL